MKEYVTVPATAMKGAALRSWIADGLAYADTLPGKTKAKKPTAKRAAAKPRAVTARARKK
jgi:hypothetical protein